MCQRFDDEVYFLLSYIDNILADGRFGRMAVYADGTALGSLYLDVSGTIGSYALVVEYLTAQEQVYCLCHLIECGGEIRAAAPTATANAKNAGRCKPEQAALVAVKYKAAIAGDRGLRKDYACVGLYKLEGVCAVFSSHANTPSRSAEAGAATATGAIAIIAVIAVGIAHDETGRGVRCNALNQIAGLGVVISHQSGGLLSLRRR